MLAVVDAVPRMHDGDRHAIAGIDLAELHAAGAAAQHDHPVGQLPQRRSLTVGPVARFLSPGSDGMRECEPTASTTLPASMLARRARLVADLDRSAGRSR